jgi:hypothetical protein
MTSRYEASAAVAKTRVADSAISAGIGQFAVIQSVAPSVGVDVSVINMHDARQIEQDITKFASSPSGGLILMGSAPAVVHQNLIVALAAQHKLGLLQTLLCYERRPNLLWVDY